MNRRHINEWASYDMNGAQSLWLIYSIMLCAGSALADLQPER